MSFTFSFRIQLLALVLIFAGCGSNSDSSANKDAQELVDACMDQLNMGLELCTCVADKAVEDLNEKEYDFLVASVGGDDEDAERLRQELSIQEAMKAGMYMTSAPASCAAAGN